MTRAAGAVTAQVRRFEANGWAIQNTDNNHAGEGGGGRVWRLTPAGTAALAALS